MPDRMIFTAEAPGWLWRAIQARRQDARVDGDTHALMLGNQDLGAAEIHKPDGQGACLGCLPAATMPWPCRQATVLLRRYRDDVGWRPHWGGYIEGD